ncbi:MAG: hypothetical protein IH998_18490, partial [Proteobacteria bacterium]|nr:hypothetical protein [Pseudomonadota bacterium]
GSQKTDASSQEEVASKKTDDVHKLVPLNKQETVLLDKAGNRTNVTVSGAPQ